jgi:ParB family chromosome partitioning protein
LALRYGTAKKSELATAAARLCAGDTIIEPETKAKALAWVPDVMRFVDLPSFPEGTEGLDAPASDEADDRPHDDEEAALEAANQNDDDASTAEAA